MSVDYCEYLRSHLNAKLSEYGLAEAGCQLFGQDFKGHGKLFAGSVIYFRGRNRLVAIAYSSGDGVSCFVGEADADPSTYKSWPSLWAVAGMADELDDNDADSVDAYLDQFPQDSDAMLALVSEKVGQVLAS